MKINYLLASIIISFLVTGFVQAAAIKVKPSEMKIKISSGILTKKEIIVENPANNVALYEVYVDNFSEWIKFRPESFTLESREKQKVILEIKNEESGIFSTMISVVAKPLSQRKFKTNAGIKIPLEIKISSEKGFFLATISQNFVDFFQRNNLIYIFSVILIMILARIYIKRKKKALAKDRYDPPNLTTSKM